MSRLLLEICPDDSPANGAAAALPPILICAHEGQDAIAFEGTLGGKPLILRFKDGACAVENPTDAKKSVMGLGEWLVAEGWKLRVTQGISMDANLSIATDDPSWAEPEIAVTTFNGTQTKRFRTVLPTAEGSELIAGRDSSKAALVIDDEHVSRAHLRFSVQNGKRLVEDLGSRWGTKLNGQPLTDPRALKHGDEIRLGKSCINYICYMDIVPETPPETTKAEVPTAEHRPFEGKTTEAKPIATPTAKPAAKTDPSPKTAGTSAAKAAEDPKAKADAPTAEKPRPAVATDVKAAKAGAASDIAAQKPAGKAPAATPAVSEAATAAGETKKPGPTPPITAVSADAKTAVSPPPGNTSDKTAAVAAAQPATPEPQKSPVLLIAGAAFVILLTLAGVAYLGYQLFVGKH